ncbi:MFS transporter [Pantoea allii]|uniref:MFS transporter n=1 Tax=Pantoea allii TaxID=574096 RepID=A0A2V2BDP9_9GAMM|nr:MFS transporter [Pantoea allii]PWK94642.1 MFS transporter [Pantoea allii]
MSSPQRVGLLSWVVALALFTDNLDASVVNLILPMLAKEFSLTLSQAGNALIAYYAGVAFTLPLGSFLSNKYGTKNCFILACLFFLAGSLLCCFACSLLIFLFGRFFHGLSSSLLIPVGRNLLIERIEKKHYLNIMSIITIPALFGPLIGPLLMGVLSENHVWRYIFFVNIPVVVFCTCIAVKLKPVSKDLPTLSFFLSGYIYLLVLFLMVFISLHSAGIKSQSVFSLASVVFFVLLFGFSFSCIRVRICSFIDISVFSSYKFFFWFIMLCSGRFFYGAVLALIPFYLHYSMRISLSNASYLMSLIAVGGLLSKPVMRLLNPFLSCDFFILLTFFLSGISYVILFSSDFYVAPIIILGLCRSLFMTSSNAMGYMVLPSSKNNSVSTYGAMAQQIFQGAGTTLAVIMFAAAIRIQNITIILFVPLLLTGISVSFFFIKKFNLYNTTQEEL